MITVAEDIKPTTEETEPTPEDTEETPEVEAHAAAEVLNLQGITTESVTGGGGAGFGSCSSCVGSFCM